MMTYSPLRYPGGKAKLAAYIREVVDVNDLGQSHYIEPFAGGAGVAFDLLINDKVKEIHINDIDRSIYAFWHSVLNNANALCDMIMECEISIDNWQKQKAIKLNYTDANLLQLGFATFFLNRTNRSGVLNAGPIGGNLQSGDWKLNCRFNRKDLVSRIKRISLFSSRINLQNMDALEFIDGVFDDAKRLSLVYLDPPYFVKGACLYQNHFIPDDHKKLADYIISMKQFHWIVSYDNVPEIKKLYSTEVQEEFDIVYSANGYSQG